MSDPNDISNVETVRENIERFDDNRSGGTKSIHHVVRYTEPRPIGPDREVIDFVTDDFKLYRFSQLSPGDPWSFEPGDDFSQPAKKAGRLPRAIREEMDDRFGADEFGRSVDEDEPGWNY